MSALDRISDSPVSAVTPEVIKTDATLPRSLLLITTCLAALSLIPPFRTIGSFALRSVALVSSGEICHSQWSQENTLGRIAKCAKVAAVTAGLIGIVASSPVIIVASLVADIGIQAMEVTNALSKREYTKALIHVTTLTTDTLIIAAMATGASSLLVTAAVVSAVAMTILAAKTVVRAIELGQSPDILEAICYSVLAALSVASAMTAASKINVTVPSERRHYVIENKGKEEAYIGDNLRCDEKTGQWSFEHLIASIKPGQTIDLDVPNTVADQRHWSYLTFNPAVSQGTGSRLYNTDVVVQRIDHFNEVVQPALSVQQYPTLPIGGNVIVTRNN